MKKVFIILILLGLSTYLFLFLYNRKSEQEQLFSTYSLSPEEIAKLRDGDIILRHGYGWVSDMIVKTVKQETDISHCAIICKNQDNFNVIHSVSSSLSDVDGVQQQSLQSFVRDSKPNSIIVVRYKNKKLSDNSLISRGAQFYLSQKVPFDNLFDIKDSTKIYCTELVHRIFLREFHEDLFKGLVNKAQDHYRFDLFLDTARFDVVINHHLK